MRMYIATGIRSEARMAPKRNQTDRARGQERPNLSNTRLNRSVNHFICRMPSSIPE